MRRWTHWANSLVSGEDTVKFDLAACTAFLLANVMVGSVSSGSGQINSLQTTDGEDRRSKTGCPAVIWSCEAFPQDETEMRGASEQPTD